MGIDTGQALVGGDRRRCDDIYGEAPTLYMVLKIGKVDSPRSGGKVSANKSGVTHLLYGAAPPYL
jgi:hypothetical protein